MTRLLSALGDALVVVRESLRLLWRHWPLLLVVYLLGAALHNATFWLAVLATRVNGYLGALILPLGPLATLVALIFMLRAVAPSLRYGAQDETVVARAVADPAEAPAPATARTRDRLRSARLAVRLRSQTVNARLRLLAATLVPFVTVYAVQGYLDRDRNAFINATVADAQRTEGFDADLTARLALDSVSSTIAVVVIALVVRWLLDAFDLPARGTGWGLFAGWVEVTWLTTVAAYFTGAWKDIRVWLQDRVLVDWIADTWAALIGWLGPVGQWVETARGWLGGLLGSVDVLVVIPIAWLTIGAVAYARTLPTPSNHRLDEVSAKVEGRLSVLPPRVRDWLRHPVSGLTSRFEGLLRGLKTLVAAGLVPMILFCLVFLLVQHAEEGLGNLVRLVIGPRGYDDMIAFSPFVDLVTGAVGTLLEVVLLAAAIDRILTRQGAGLEASGASVAVEPSASPAGAWVDSLRAGARSTDR